jgi:predicted ATP-dependent Lon-type protease
MVKKEIMDKVRTALRERRNSHFSEVYFRATEHKISSIEVHKALYEMLKRDEAVTTNGKWKMIEDRRKTSRAM